MSLRAVPPCCPCPDHQDPHLNEDGWVLTGHDDATWEAWTQDEWRIHCYNHSEAKREREAATARDRHRRKRSAYRARKRDAA